MNGSHNTTKRVLVVIAILMAVFVLGMVLLSKTFEEDGCYRLTSALRWLGKTLSMF